MIDIGLLSTVCPRAERITLIYPILRHNWRQAGTGIGLSAGAAGVLAIVRHKQLAVFIYGFAAGAFPLLLPVDETVDCH